MANAAVTTENGEIIEVSFTDAGANWNIAADLPQYNNAIGIKVRQIILVPSAANDVFRIRNGSATGPDIVNVKCAATNVPPIPIYGSWIRPYLVISEQTFGTVASAKILIHLA